MPERAEPCGNPAYCAHRGARRPESREFPLSEYQRSGYKAFALLCACCVALASTLAMAVTLGAQPIEFSYATAAFVLAVAFSGWCSLVKAGKPFARLTPHGLTLQDGALLPWSSPWTSIYAIESPGRHRADLRLAGMRARRVALTMLEREDRREFVEAVRKWIYSAH